MSNFYSAARGRRLCLKDATSMANGIEAQLKQNPLQKQKNIHEAELPWDHKFVMSYLQ